MEIEKERLSNRIFLPKWIWLEHDARYFFASKLVPNKIVVDCACGSGVGTNVFAKAGAKQIYAFDIAEKAVQEAAEKNKNQAVSFQSSSALQLPLQNDTVDLYISLETIEHIPEDKKFLKEVERVLQPNGAFICSTPNRTVTNPGKNINDKPANNFHVREYSKKEFELLLKSTFKNVEFFGQNPNYKAKISTLQFFSKVLPKNAVVRIHQALKLLNSFLAKKSYYSVQKIKPDREYEYVVAVCKN